MLAATAWMRLSKQLKAILKGMLITTTRKQQSRNAGESMQYLWLLIFVLAAARLLLLFWETSGWLALQW